MYIIIFNPLFLWQIFKRGSELSVYLLLCLINLVCVCFYVYSPLSFKREMQNKKLFPSKSSNCRTKTNNDFLTWLPNYKYTFRWQGVENISFRNIFTIYKFRVPWHLSMEVFPGKLKVLLCSQISAISCVYFLHWVKQLKKIMFWKIKS